MGSLETEDPGAPRRARWIHLSIAGSLFLLVLGVYAPVRHYGFVNYDDYFYVTRNQHVLDRKSVV